MDMLGVKDKYMKKLRDNGYIGYSREKFLPTLQGDIDDLTKKKYQKPGMPVCPLMKHAQLLNNSHPGGGTSNARRFGSPWEDEEE